VRPQSQFPHSCVCEQSMYICPRSVHLFSCSRTDRPILGIYKSLTEKHECRNLGLRHSSSFFWEYLFRIFGIVSLQDTSRSWCGDLAQGWVWEGPGAEILTTWSPYIRHQEQTRLSNPFYDTHIRKKFGESRRYFRGSIIGKTGRITEKSIRKKIKA
jgi:hypothetical protein